MIRYNFQSIDKKYLLYNYFVHESNKIARSITNSYKKESLTSHKNKILERLMFICYVFENDNKANKT